MLRGYYDGGGKSDDPNCRFLTLAGLIASESVWEEFEVEWFKVLSEYDLARFHTTDLMRLEKKDGWTHERVIELILKLWKLLGEFRPSFGVRRSNLLALTCTVLMEDYRRAKNENSSLREAEAICVNFCTSALPEKDLDSDKEPLELIMVFDDKEAFQKTITRVWQDFHRHPEAGWPKQIRNILRKTRELLVVGSSNAAPLQAADLLAWTMNNKHICPERMPWADIMVAFALNHRHKTYDYDAIMKRYPNV